jgi:mannose-6-phosphate isomerase-like protein (cupin superfamily)
MNIPNLERIVHGERLLAIVIRSGIARELQATKQSMLFTTPDEFGLQLGVHNRHHDETIAGHFHVPFAHLTELEVQEFFYVYAGKLAITLYDSVEHQNPLEEVVVGTGDAILLNTGHSFRFLADTQMLEIKQGPYRGKHLEKIIISSRS